MTEERPKLHIVRSVFIEGAVADAVDDLRRGINPAEIVRIKDLDADLKKLPVEEDTLHVCPLCGEGFTWVLFKAHAPECIAARGRDVVP